MFRKPVVIVLAVALSSSGCCHWDECHTDSAIGGGLVGAGAGALIGSMTGSWAWGALIGAGTGALAGYVIADNNEYYRSKRDAAYVADDQRLRGEADREFRIAMQAKDSATAEYHLRRSIEFYPTPAAHNNLGMLQLSAGDREGARASFRNAIALEPRYEPALQNLEKIGGA
jgi:osmotically inducible lipoprotein OsmB